MYCSKCGTELKDGSSFCGGCGEKVFLSDNNKVDLVIIRKKRFLGLAISFTVLVDDVNVGLLKNGGRIDCKLTRGKHKVVLKAVEKDTVQEIDLNESTKCVEIHTTAKMGLLAAVCKIEEVKYI